MTHGRVPAQKERPVPPLPLSSPTPSAGASFGRSKSSFPSARSTAAAASTWSSGAATSPTALRGREYVTRGVRDGGGHPGVRVHHRRPRRPPAARPRPRAPGAAAAPLNRRGPSALARHARSSSARGGSAAEGREGRAFCRAGESCYILEVQPAQARSSGGISRRRRRRRRRRSGRPRGRRGRAWARPVAPCPGVEWRRARGLLWLTARAALAVQARIRAALGIYENKLGPDHHSTKDVTKSLEQLEGAAAQPGGANAPEPPREHTGRPGARCCGMSALYGPSPLKHVIVWKSVV